MPALAPRQLAAFVAIAETGGFAAAAARLGLAQSSVSTLLRDMEDRLGLRLVARTTRRAELTEAGARLLPHARRLLAEMEAVLREMAPLAGGVLRVAATSLVAATLLPRALALLARRPAAPRPTLIEADPAELPGLVRRGEVRLALGSFPAAGIAGLGRRHLLRDEIALFCPSDHPLAPPGRTACRWRDLAVATRVGVPRESEVGRLVADALEAGGAPVAPPAFEVARMQTALALVAAGLGVAALPRTAAPLVPRGPGPDVVVLDLRPVVRRDVVAIWRGAAEPREARAVLRALAAAARTPEAAP